MVYLKVYYNLKEFFLNNAVHFIIRKQMLSILIFPSFYIVMYLRLRALILSKLKLKKKFNMNSYFHLM